MTALQARLLARRAVVTVQAHELMARRYRAGDQLPLQVRDLGTDAESTQPDDLVSAAS